MHILVGCKLHLLGVEREHGIGLATRIIALHYLSHYLYNYAPYFYSFGRHGTSRREYLANLGVILCKTLNRSSDLVLPTT